MFYRHSKGGSAMKGWQKACIIIAIIIIAVVIVAVTPVLNIPLVGLYGWIESLMTIDPLNLAFVLGAILLAVILAFWLIPILIYVFKKLCIYVSLRCICLSRKHKFKALRMPFASLKCVSPKGDIRITTDEGDIYLHFLDIVFTTRRALTILDDRSYSVTRTGRGPASHLGRGHINGYSVPYGKTWIVHAEHQELVGGTDKIKHIEPIETKDGEVHLLIIQSVPVESRALVDGALKPLVSGQSFGTLRFFSIKMLKQALKGKLHTSVFD